MSETIAPGLVDPKLLEKYRGLLIADVESLQPRADAAIRATSDLTPDQNARALAVANRTGFGMRAARSAVKMAPPGQAFRLDTRYREIVRANPNVARWLADPDNAGIGRDDLEALAKLDNALVPIRSGGFWAGLGSAAEGRTEQLRASAWHLGAAYGLTSIEEAAEGVAAAHRRMGALREDRPLSAVLFEASAAEGDWIEAVTNVPGWINFIAQQVPNAVPVIAGGAAGAFGGAKIGGAIGGTPAGAAIGGTVGLVGGSFAAAVPVEAGAWIDGALSKRGVDLTDPAQIVAAYSDPALMAAIKAEGERKGLVTAAVDSLFNLFAGAGVARQAGKGLIKVAKAGAKELAVQTGVEAGSEAAGQLAATGRIDPQDVMLEALGGLGQSAAEVAIGASVRLGARPVVEAAGKALQARQDATALREAKAAYDGSAAAKRHQERVGRLVEVAGGGDAGPLMVDRVAWDAHFRGSGRSPVSALEAVVPDGARAYAESGNTGQIEVPLTAALAKIEAADFEALLPAMRVRPNDPNAMTLAEADVVLERMGEALRAELATTEQKAREAPEDATEADEARAAELERAVGLPEGAGVLFQQAAVPAGEPRGVPAEEAAPAAEAKAEAPSKPAEAPSSPDLRALADAIEAAAPGVVGRVVNAVTGAEPVAEAARTAGAPDVAAAAQRDPAGTAANLRELADIQDRQAKREGPTATVRRKIEAALRAAGRPAAEAKAGAQVISTFVRTMSARYPEVAPAAWERFALKFARGVAPPGALASGPRGAFDRLTRTIYFTEHADASTLFHEFGHAALDFMVALAPEVPALQSDVATAIADIGGLTREGHEKFADSFVDYLQSGKAPSSALRRVFAALAQWLRSLLPGVKASPELRGVFDRMLATDAEIERARYDAGLTELPAELLAAIPADERAAVIQASQDATDAATVAVAREALAGLRREAVKARRAAIEAAKPAIAAAFDEQPGSRALRDLKSGGVTLDRKATLDRLPTGSKRREFLEGSGVLTDGGSAPDAVAGAYGFGSLDELADALRVAANKDAVVEKLARLKVPTETLPTAQLRDLARKAVTGTERSKALQAELRAFTLAAAKEQAEAGAREGRATRRAEAAETEAAATAAAAAMEREIKRQALAAIPPIGLVRAQARIMLDALPLRAIRPHVYLASARREGRLATQLIRTGSYQLAAETKRRELLNHELYTAALKRREDAEKVARFGESMLTERRQATLGKAGGSFKANANAILDGYSFARIPDVAVVHNAELRAWAEAQASESGGYVQIDIPETVLTEAKRVHWSELTHEQLLAVRDALRSIWRAANERVEDFKDAQGRTVAERSTAMQGAVRASRKGRKPPPLDRLTDAEEAVDKWGRFVAAHRKVGSLTREMDSLAEGGSATTFLFRPLAQAQANESVRRGVEAERIHALYRDVYTKDEMAHFSDRRQIAGVTISSEGLVTVALYSGSIEGRQRLAEMFTPEQRAALLAALDAKDVRFVNSIYKYLETFWPEIAAQEERLTGITPERVEALPSDVPAGKLGGGYFPIRYADEAAERKAVEVQAKDVQRGAALRAVTKRGYRYSRVAEIRDRTLRLNLDTLTEHVTEVVHALTHQDAVLEVGRLLRDKGLRRSIAETYGVAVLKQLDSWLTDVAGGDVTAYKEGERALGFLRRGTVTAILGWRIMTAIINTTGYVQSIHRIGADNVARGFRKWIVAPNEMTAAVRAKSAFMRTRPKTLQREINEIRGRLTKEKRTALRESYFAVLTATQTFVDVPTWIGAYDQAIAAKPADVSLEAWEAEAVARADQAVRDSQGGGQLVDLAGVERGSPAMKLLTVFYGYANTTFNRTVEARAAARGRGYSALALGRLVADMLLLLTVPAFFDIAVKAAFRERERDDLLERGAKRTLASVAGLMVGFREFSGVIEGFDYGGPAGLRLVGQVARAGREFADSSFDDDDLRAINSVGGLVLGYPAEAMNTASRAAQELYAGDIPAAIPGLVGLNK